MRGAVCIVMVRHIVPMHQGMCRFFSFAMARRHPLSTHGKGLAENKKQQNSGNKPTHGMKARRIWESKNYTVFR